MRKEGQIKKKRGRLLDWFGLRESRKGILSVEAKQTDSLFLMSVCIADSTRGYLTDMT